MNRIFGSALLVGIIGCCYGQSSENVVAKFNRQVSASCEAGIVLQKEITDLGQGEGFGRKQTRTFELNCAEGTGKDIVNGQEISMTLANELWYAQAYDYANPYFRQYFEVERTCQCLTATVKQEKKSRTPLKKQVSAIDSVSGVLRYFESQILKDDLLYDLNVSICVYFDADGIYLEHFLETSTGAIFSKDLNTVIHCKRIQSE